MNPVCLSRSTHRHARVSVLHKGANSIRSPQEGCILSDGADLNPAVYGRSLPKRLPASSRRVPHEFHPLHRRRQFEFAGAFEPQAENWRWVAVRISPRNGGRDARVLPRPVQNRRYPIVAAQEGYEFVTPGGICKRHAFVFAQRSPPKISCSAPALFESEPLSATKVSNRLFDVWPNPGRNRPPPHVAALRGGSAVLRSIFQRSPSLLPTASHFASGLIANAKMEGRDGSTRGTSSSQPPFIAGAT